MKKKKFKLFKIMCMIFTVVVCFSHVAYAEVDSINGDARISISDVDTNGEQRKSPQLSFEYAANPMYNQYKKDDQTGTNVDDVCSQSSYSFSIGNLELSVDPVEGTSYKYAPPDFANAKFNVKDKNGTALLTDDKVVNSDSLTFVLTTANGKTYEWPATSLKNLENNEMNEDGGMRSKSGSRFE